MTLAAPTILNSPTIDWGTLVQLPTQEVQLTIKVVDRFGAVNESYNGEVIVGVYSPGGGVRLNGSWGQVVVTIEDGLGTFYADASAVSSGARVFFDLFAQRTDPYRASIVVQ